MLWREGWRVLTLGSTILLRKKRLNKKPILLTEGLLTKLGWVHLGRFGGMCSTMVSCMKTRTGSMCSGTRQRKTAAREACQRHPERIMGALDAEVTGRSTLLHGSEGRCRCTSSVVCGRKGGRGMAVSKNLL